MPNGEAGNAGPRLLSDAPYDEAPQQQQYRKGVPLIEAAIILGQSRDEA
jgi:hypothetical protein